MARLPASGSDRGAAAGDRNRQPSLALKMRSTCSSVPTVSWRFSLCTAWRVPMLIWRWSTCTAPMAGKLSGDGDRQYSWAQIAAGGAPSSPPGGRAGSARPAADGWTKAALEWRRVRAALTPARLAGRAGRDRWRMPAGQPGARSALQRYWNARKSIEAAATPAGDRPDQLAPLS